MWGSTIRIAGQPHEWAAAIGKPQLCDVGAKINATFRQPDGTTRMHRNGVDLQTFSGLGALAERIVAPSNACVKLPDDAPLDKAALIGCSVMTGVGAVFNTAQVHPGSSVAVFGAGGVGLNVIQGAAIAGAERIIAVDINPRKLEFAAALGATEGIDASARDPLPAIRAERDAELARIDEELTHSPDGPTRRRLRRERRKLTRRYRRKERSRDFFRTN